MVLLFLGVNVAHAQLTISQKKTYSGNPGFEAPLSFARFNPALGHLTSVQIITNLNTTGGFLSVDNDGANPASASVRLGATGRLTSGDVMLLDNSASQIGDGLEVFTGETFTLSADNGDGTGNVDPTAPDGATHDGGNDAVADNGFVGDAFREFSGKSYVGAGNYTITMDADALIDFGGLGGVEGSFGPPLVAGDVEVIYTYTPYSADLGIVKDVSDATPDIGDNISYTLTAHNYGPDDATGVIVTDNLPAGMDFVSASGDGSYNDVTGIWTIGNLDDGDDATLTINVTVDGTGIIINTATISSDVDDPNPTNDTDNSSTTTPTQIDLELTKSASSETPNYKSNVTFTLTVRNTSPYDNATGVTVTDALPAGLTYISHSGGTYNSGTGIWNVGTVNKNNGSQSLQITARVDQVGAITNAASVITANEPDKDSTPGSGTNEDDDDSVDLTVPAAADLRLTKTVDQANRNLGQQVVYTLTVYNDGPNNATGVTVSDALPAGVSFVSTTGAYNDGTDTWTIGNLANGASASITITATVTGTGSIINTAEVETSDQHDPDSTPGTGSNEDDDDDVTVSVPKQVDLELSKSVDDNTPDYGDNIVYTLTVRNTSTYDNATGVTVTDILPTGLSYVSHTGGSYNSATGVWNVGTVNRNNGSATLKITARVSDTGSIENFTQVSACNENDVDSTPGDGDQGDDDDAKVTITVDGAADLRLTKTASKLDPELNENVTFTLTVVNDGPDAATNVEVTDNLPTGLSFVSDDGSYNDATGVWSVGNLATGASASLHITAKVTQTGSIINAAEVTASDQYDPDSTPGSGSNEDDDDSVELDVPRIVDLRLDKSVNNASPNYLDNVVFTISVVNDGPDAASGIAVSDALPSGLDYVSDNSGGSYNSGSGVWSIGSLNKDATASLEITARVTATGTLTNTAQISACDDDDTDSTPGNNIGTEDDQDDAVVNTSQAADLRIEKTVDNATANLGQRVTFTITLTNDGPDAPSAISVLDALPAGFNFESSDPDQGSYDDSNGIWTVGSLGSGSSTTLEIVASVTATGSKTNTARVESSNLYDPDSTPGNNIGSEDDQDTAVVNTSQAADVRLEKNVDNATPGFGENVIYSITITNEGPDAATGLEVEDVLPASMNYVSHTGGSYDVNSGTWSIGTLNAAASTTLNITATVNGTGSITNTAQVSAMNEYDIDSTPANNIGSEDDQDNADINVAPAVDLSLDKSATPMNPGNGENVTFTLTVTNSSSHDDATGVVVKDNLISGLSFVSASGDGSYDENTGLWTIGTVAKSGGTASIDLIVRMDQAGSMPNFAEVVACNEWDIDSTPDNGAQGEDDEDQVTLGVLEISDLSLVKSVDNSTPHLGTNIIYTLVVTNDGPDDASNIEIADALPLGVSYVSHTGGNYDLGSGIWDVNNLATGASTTLLITAKVTGTGTINNVAQVSSVDQRDPDSTPDNNISSEDDQDNASIVVPPSVDLELDKAVDNATPNYFSNIIFTLQVTNTSTHDDASNVTVTDVLPQGLSYVSASGDGSYDAATGLWTIGNVVKNGGMQTINITAKVEITGDVVNIAQVASCNEIDIDSTPGNNDQNEDDYDAVSLKIAQAADLRLSKGANTTKAELGDTVHFKIIVKNDGPDTATDVSVIDRIPDAFELISSEGFGSYNAESGQWYIGTMSINSRAEYRFVTIMRATGAKSNVAEIYHSDQYDPDSTPNNRNQSEDDWDYAYINGDAMVDLELVKTANTATPNYLGILEYTLKVSNVSSHDDALNVKVIDILPEGLKYISSEGQGTYNHNTGLWIVGTISKSGGKAIMKIKTRVETTGEIVNFAQVSACDQEDMDSKPDNGPSEEDDEDEISVLVAPSADLELDKTVNVDVQYVEQTVKYTLTLTNTGPDSALGVTVSDKLPLGLTFVSDTGDGLYNADSGIWTIGSMEVDQIMKLEITALLSPALDSLVNVAEVVTAERYDPDSVPDNGADEDDRDVVTVTPIPRSDLRLSKTVDADTVGLGEVVQFTLIAFNDGPNNATGVSVKDLLPSGLAYISHNNGNYSPTSGIWNIGNLAVNTADTLYLRASADMQGGHSNIAEIFTCDQDDIDSTPGNAENGEDDIDTASVYISASGIGDTVWHDEDANGKMDNSENGLSNVLVKLLIGDNVFKTARTDTAGHYFFANLNAGTYSVTIDSKSLPEGMALTTNNLPWSTVLTAGGINLDADFGYKISGGSIGDEVWYDADGNGKRSSSELEGVTDALILLKDEAGRLIKNTTTDTTGYYKFEGLEPGSYRVEIDATTLRPGVSLTTASYYLIDLSLDANVDTVDFGVRFMEGNVGSIGNLIWKDTDRDGVQDADESTGIAGIEVVLMDGSGNVMARDVTDDDGNYLFNFLSAGNYWVDVNSHDSDMPDGYFLTTDNEPHYVALEAGEDYSDADFGYMDLDPALAVLGDYTWHDENWNRNQDNEESFLSWIDVQLLQGGEVIKQQKTDLWGYYQFVNLQPGTYKVKAQRSGPVPPQSQMAKKSVQSFEPWQMTTVDSFMVTLAAGDVYLKADFGFAYPQDNWGAGQEKILARYQPWYGAADSDSSGRHWDFSYFGGQSDTSLFGFYDSQNQDLADYNILSAWAAGIDGFVVDWYGKNSYENIGARLLLDRAEALTRLYEHNGMDFQIAISYNEHSIGALDSNFTYISDSLMTHPAYWGVREDLRKPLFIYNFAEAIITPDVYRACADTILPVGSMLIWNNADTTAFTSMDGIYPWIQPKDNIWDDQGQRWGREHLEYSYETVNRDNRGRIAFTLGAVWPGLDDSQWINSKDRYIDRQDTVVYQSTWDMVHNYRESGTYPLPMPWCLVETWNDFNNATQIEPTLHDGYLFSVLTRENARRFKTNTNDIEVGVEDLGMAVPKHIHQARIAAQLRPEAAAGIHGLANKATAAFFERNHLLALSYADVASGLAIKNLSTSVLENGTILLNWEKAESADSYLICVAYDIARFNPCSDIMPEMIPVGNVDEFQLSGYDAEKNLCVSVIAVNSELGPFANQGWYENSVTGVVILRLFDDGGSQTGIKDEAQSPTLFRLEQNYPNPFNPTTTIKYAVPHAEHVIIDIFDIQGRHIETLVDEQKYAGEHMVVFVANDLASGIYFCRIKAGSYTKNCRMLLMK